MRVFQICTNVRPTMILGEPMNVNEAGLDFRLDEDDSNEVILRLFLPKFLDTQLIDVDAQPKYVRVKVKGKSFQVVFRSEVKPDDGKCERSQLTGEMKITLPKLFNDPRYELVSTNGGARVDEYYFNLFLAKRN